MDTKLRLKQMSHKKLRKLCKAISIETVTSNQHLEEYRITANKLSIELQDLRDKSSEGINAIQALKQVRKELNNVVRSFETYGEDRNCHWCRARIEEKLLVLTNNANEYRERIADLEHALDALGYESKGEFIESMTELGKVYDPTYIGQMPDELNMGVDGQLKTEEERYTAVEQSEITEEAEHAAWVASEVARVLDEAEGHVPFDEPTNGVSDPMELGTIYHEEAEKKYTDPLVAKTFDQPTEEESEAVEWAKRNGHHFPNGRPEKDKSSSVVVTYPEAINQENRSKHEEMKP